MLLVCGFLAGCAVRHGPPCVKDGKTYGGIDELFRGRWYSYYKRALSYMEGECYDAALADLKAAIAQKYEDQRMARTYGMLFIDYFPHREKGLIHYLQGDFNAARQELSLSMKQRESDKARFYLNQIQMRRLRETRPAETAPVIFIHEPADTDEIRMNKTMVAIKGVAEDSNYISEIIISGTAYPVDTPETTISFQKELKLKNGFNEIVTAAVNLLGRSSEKTIGIYVDQSGPVISIQRIIRGKMIQGTVHDESGIDSIRINSRPISFSAGTAARFTYPLDSKTKQVSILAADKFKNETTAGIDLESGAGSDQRSLDIDGRWASVATDAFLYGYRKQNAEPSIHVNGWRKNDHAFREQIFISGHVNSLSPIETLHIDTIPIVTENSGRIVFFNQAVSLAPGENDIEIHARNRSGQKSVETIFITRKIPEMLKYENRYRLRCHPFKGAAKSGSALASQYLLIREITGRRRFQTVLQTDLARILREHQLMKRFSDSAVFEQPACNAHLMGAVYDTRHGVEIVARIVDAASGTLLRIEDVYDEAGDDTALPILAKRLSDKFHRAFPLVQGPVFRDHGNIIIKTEGEMRMNWPVLLYRKKENQKRHAVPDRGNDYEITGRARISEIREDGYGIAGNGKTPLSNGDRAIAR